MRRAPSATTSAATRRGPAGTQGARPRARVLVLALAGLLAALFSGPSSAAADDDAATPANRRAAKVLERLDAIAGNLTETRYQHRTKIRARDGLYYWDCSAMAAYIIAKVAPAARKALTRERPVARDFYQVIRDAPTRGDRDGWRRLPSIRDVRPGDVFAWKRPKDFPSKNTGHVGFVLEAPAPAPEWPGAYLVRIADATSLPHQDDTRERDSDGGFGHGTILFLTDENGRGIAYGWFGARSRGVITTPIAFGRLIR
ncbi:MAG: hypothetical protein R3A79_02275 [Nannocystaceae bacterium]